MIGIYKITNSINGKIYIGKSTNIFERWSEHWTSSRNINKRATNLHKDIAKYGIENFCFEILEICESKNLTEEEDYFINYFQSWGDNGYNEKTSNCYFTKIGEKANNAKLTNDDVYNIREEYKLIHRKLDVYEKYKDKISINTFSDIWIGKTWKSIHYDVYTPENKALQRNNYDTFKSHLSKMKVSIEDVIKIRNFRNDLWSPKECHQKFFSHINVNTFNDIWLYKTYVDVLPTNERKKGKVKRFNNQEGLLNPRSMFNRNQLIDIKIRQRNNESMDSVYDDYKFVSRLSFKKLWDGKTYKNFDLEKELELRKE